jgi:hypothetical protein
MVGTAEHKLRLRDEESDEEEDEDPNKPKKRRRRKLKPIQAKPLTAEELRDLETQGFASTASEDSEESDDATASDDGLFRDGSETMSLDSRDYRDRDARELAQTKSFLSKTSSSFKASVHSTGKFIAKTLSKASSKSYREKRRRMKAMEGTLPFDASAEGTSFAKAGSFKGSFKKQVHVEKAGSISRHNSSSGRVESVDVYRERDTDGRESRRGEFAADGGDRSAAMSRASGKFSRAQSVLSGGLSAISESEREGSIKRGGSVRGGGYDGRSHVSDDPDADPDGTEFTGDPTEDFSTEDERGSSADEGADPDDASDADGSRHKGSDEHKNDGNGGSGQTPRVGRRRVRRRVRGGGGRTKVRRRLGKSSPSGWSAGR